MAKKGMSEEFRAVKRGTKSKNGMTKKTVMIVVLAVLVIAILTAAVFGIKYLLSGRDGSAKVNPFTGKPILGDNWLVCLSDGKYYKVGEVSAISGFELENRTTLNEQNYKPVYIFKPVDAEEEIDNYTVTMTAKNYSELATVGYDAIVKWGPETISDLETDVIDGKEVSYFYYMMPFMNQEGTDIECYMAYLTCYMDCGRDDCCVLIQIQDQEAEKTNVASQRILYNYVDNIIKRVMIGD